MLQIGSYVDGKYKVLNKIGQGGMSVVYLALNEKANKTWAIKEVRKDGVQDFTTVKQGLIAETNILKSLNHKYLPSIIDVIDDGDSFLIVMDYIQGKSLDKILKTSMEKDGLPIALDDVISWGKQLCEVFYYLHTRPNPIIYRDMKPGNVMLKPDGEISLIEQHEPLNREIRRTRPALVHQVMRLRNSMGETDSLHREAIFTVWERHFII